MPKEPEKRKTIIDRVYDAGKAVRKFANGVINTSGDYIGDRVGGAYQYVGDVASYAYKRKRGIVTAAETPKYKENMKDMDESSKLSTGAIIGIIAGGVCFLLLCVASICYYTMGNSKQQGAIDP